jgi:hypothetical protein
MLGINALQARKIRKLIKLTNFAINNPKTFISINYNIQKFA